MVRPCSGPASSERWQGAPKTRSTPCHRKLDASPAVSHAIRQCVVGTAVVAALAATVRRDLWMLLSLLERQQRSCDGSPQMPRQRLRSILNRFNLKPSRSNGPAALTAHHLNAHLDRRNRRQEHRACEVSASARCRQHDRRYEQYSCNQKRFAKRRLIQFSGPRVPCLG